MNIVYESSRANSPVPVICVFGIVFTLASNLAFRHHFDLMGQALAVNTVIMALVAFVSFLSLSDERPLPGTPWTPKVIRNYNRIAMLVGRTLAYGLLACFCFIAAAGLSSAGLSTLAGIVCALGIGAFGLTLFTYLQGPTERMEY